MQIMLSQVFNLQPKGYFLSVVATSYSSDLLDIPTPLEDNKTMTTATTGGPVDRMNAVEMRGLAYIEKFWIQHGKFPKTIPVDGFNLQEAMEKESFIRGLFNRGITPPDHSKDLSDSQMAAILIVADHHDRRSITAKLKSIGISSQTWQGWMQDKNFKEYLHHLTSKNFDAALHVAQQGLLASVEKGDVNAIKYWHELTGRAVSPEVQNARILISRIVQVIQTHVKDEAILMAIARDFERVMKGESPSPVVMLPPL